ncbi:related to phosphoethanolamine N-methyltransferase [Ustilago trichophora]|uniref:Related to phosphoethanolamine N-methyltransferase n=1 Tax=Ustilago trichophora TaxID=86804 RepID=A0A5C3EG15_9BASI|nr:related to phosphoethanolamine N-methyltransferase [Ustilago trichophora]
MTTPNYSTGNDRFDAEAATWDTKPEVVLSSKLCLESILAHSPSHFPALSASSVLEIGCGTGLLTIPLAQHVQNILALDTAQGMISMLDAKIDANGLTEKVRAKVKLLEDPEDEVLEGKEWDAVVSHLVFHHVPDMLELVKVMFGTLKEGGRVWISDFEDNGIQAEAFHPKEKHAGVERHGLKRKDMEAILTEAGFKDVEVFTSFTMEKEVESGGVQAFPFLAITGIKR